MIYAAANGILIRRISIFKTNKNNADGSTMEDTCNLLHHAFDQCRKMKVPCYTMDSAKYRHNETGPSKIGSSRYHSTYLFHVGLVESASDAVGTCRLRNELNARLVNRQQRVLHAWSAILYRLRSCRSTIGGMLFSNID